MSNIQPSQISQDKAHIHLSRNFIKTCRADSVLDYSKIKDLLDNTFNVPSDLIITILYDDTCENDYQAQIKSIKIPALQKVAQEVLNYKSRILAINRSANNIIDESNPHFGMIQKIQNSLISLANQSKSQNAKSIADSMDKSHPDLSKMEELLQSIIKDGLFTAETHDLQKEMAKLCSKLFGDKKVDESTPLHQSEKLIVDSFKDLKEKVKYLTNQMKNEDQLISTLKSQIGDLKDAIKSKNENQSFQEEIAKHFKNIENSLNNNKYDELFNNYKEAFDRIGKINSGSFKDDFQKFADLDNNRKLNQFDSLKKENDDLKKKYSEIKKKFNEYKLNTKNQKEEIQKENLEKEDLKKKLSELQNQLKDHDATSNSLKEEYQNDIENKQKHIDDLIHECEELKKKISELQQKEEEVKSQLNDQNDASKLMKEEYQKDINKKQKLIDERNGKNEELMNKVSELQQQLEEVQNQLKDHDEVSKSMNEEQQNDINNKQQQIQKLNCENEDLKKKVSELQQQLTKVQNQLKVQDESSNTMKIRYENDLNNKRKEIETVNQEKEELYKKVSELQQQLEKVQNQLKDQDESSKSLNDKQQNDINSKQQQIQQLNHEKEELKKKVSELQNQLKDHDEASKSINEEQRNDINSKQQQIQELNHENEELNKKLSELQQQHENIQNQLRENDQASKSTIEKHQKDINNKQQLIEKLKKKLIKLQQQHEQILKQKDESNANYEDLLRDYTLVRSTLSVMMKKYSELNKKLEEVTEIENIDEVMEEFNKRTNKLNEMQKENTLLKIKLNKYREFGAVINEEKEPNAEKTDIYINCLISEIEKTLNIQNNEVKQSFSIEQRIQSIKSKIQEIVSNNRKQMKEFDAVFIRIDEEVKKIESETVSSSEKVEQQNVLLQKNNELKTIIIKKEKLQKQNDSLSLLDESLPNSVNSNEMKSIVLHNLLTFSGNPTVDRFIKILQLKDDENEFPFLQQISVSMGKIYRTLEYTQKVNQKSDLSLPFDICDAQDLKVANVKYAYLFASISKK